MENPVPSTSSADNEGTNCPSCEHKYDDDWIQCGLCKEWWHEECSSYEGSEHLHVTTAKFSVGVLLASRPAYSYSPRR
ncbi:hypothetical protein AVEN_190677-1, partial [Araneus ventricosus]